MATEESKKLQVLVIEDNKVVADLMTLILEPHGYNVRTAADGDAGLAITVGWQPDIVLCDVMLPSIDGFEVLRRVQRNPDLAHIPFVFISSKKDHETVRSGMHLGADDYLSKPFSPEDLLLAVQSRIKRTRFVKRRHEEAVKNWEQQRILEVQFDVETGLPNELSLSEQLEERYGRDGFHLAVFQIGPMDHLKGIVGRAGTAEVMKEAAARIQNGDMVFRGGPSELFLLLPRNIDVPAEETVEGRLRSLLAPFPTPAGNVRLLASAGLVKYGDLTDSESAPKAARLAAIEASDAGGNTVRTFSRALNDGWTAGRSLATDLEEALEEGRYEVFYQPQVEIAGGRITGMEALARLRDRDGTLVSPTRWVQIAERNGLISQIGYLVMRKACRDTKEHFLPAIPDFRVSVNVSGRQLDDPIFADHIRSILGETGLPPRCLEIEVTESTAMKDPETSAVRLRDVVALGVSVAIDDFGTGYSSLAYLRQLPVAALKIDRAFVRDIPHDLTSAAIVKNIMDLAGALHLTTTAEGVENADQMRFLIDLGCRFAQGYYFSAPQPLTEILPFLKKWKSASTAAMQPAS